MAPKKGGSSGSSSSGSGASVTCNYCTEPLLLRGRNWRDKRTDAMFAIEIIVMVTLIGCLVLATRFRWTRMAGTDRLRHFGYVLATVSAFIFYLFNVVDTGLSESLTETTYLYYLTYIFASLFWRLAELLILGIILRTLCESTSARGVQRLNGLHITVIVLLTLLSAGAYGLYVAQIAYTLIDGGFYYRSLYYNRGYVQLAYQALYFVVSIYAGLLGLFLAAKQRTKAALLMAGFVLPALFLRSLMALVAQAVNDFPEGVSYKNEVGVVWGNVFVYDLATCAIFVGVALIGFLFGPLDPGVLEHKTTADPTQQGVIYTNVPMEYNNQYGNVPKPTQTGYANTPPGGYYTAPSPPTTYGTPSPQPYAAPTGYAAPAGYTVPAGYKLVPAPQA